MKEIKQKYRLFISILVIAIIYIMLICHFSNNMLKLKVTEKTIEIESLKDTIDKCQQEIKIYQNAKGMNYEL